MPTVPSVGLGPGQSRNPAVEQTAEADRIDKKKQPTQAEWAGLWLIEGGPGDKADLASAVVMAESGGRADIYNGICCWGGYQFNTNTLRKECAVVPSCATRAAISTSKGGTDWSKWETFTNGDYKKYLGKSGARYQGSGGVFSGLPDPLKGLDAIAAVLEKVAQFFVGLGEILLTPEGWLRLGKLGAGVILVIAGTNRLAKLSFGIDPVGAITSGAFAALPVGRGFVGKIGGVGRGAGEAVADAASEVAGG